MTTTREYKRVNRLTDSAFQRLRNKIQASYPDQELIRRINSRDWLIVDVALFDHYLSVQKGERVITNQASADAVLKTEIEKLKQLQASIKALIAEEDELEIRNRVRSRILLEFQIEREMRAELGLER